MRLLKSKHQRLILQCYPPGKNVDKKPNPSELSYLLYYATTRRTKLLKVGLFLQKKVISDYHHNRTGNLMVSLDIINGLIDKCSENLDAFAENLMVIFKHILLTNDLALCQYSLPIFTQFCKQINSDIFGGDLEFINKFESVCQSFVDFGFHPIGGSPNESDWKVLSLKSIQSFSSTLPYNNGLTETLVNYSMPLILNNIYDLGKSDLDSHLAPDGNNELKKLATIKQVTTAISHSLLLPSDTVEGEAYRALNKLFDTTSNSTGNQLQNSSNALIDYIIEHKVSDVWSNRLLQLAVNWIPVSSRFKFLDSLFQKLLSTENSSIKLALTRLISGLLSSPVTMISLDIPGTLKLLCREQLDIVGDNEQGRELILSYTDCIKSLTSHIYYRNQVSDIISGLLKECYELYDTHTLQGKYKRKVQVLFSDIQALLEKPYNDINESFSLDIWEDTFPLLLLEDKELSSLYSDLLSTYLKMQVKTPEIYQKPNFSKYITNQFNSLAQFFQCINDYFHTEIKTVEKESNLNSLIPVLLELIRRFGINTIANGLTFFFDWQFKDLNSVGDSEKLKDTFLFIFLYESSLFMELQELTRQVLEKIKFRANRHLLSPSKYTYPDLDLVLENGNPFVTKEMISEQISDKSLLLSWLNLDSKPNSKDELSSILNISLSKQPSINQLNGTLTEQSLAIPPQRQQLPVLSNGLANATNNGSGGTSPSISTPTTSIHLNNNLDHRSETTTNHSTTMNRSFSPISILQPKPSPRVLDLKRAISGGSLKVPPGIGGNGSIRDAGIGSSLVSSRIIDDVGSLLADLDVNGDLSSDEDASYSKGRLVK